MLATNFRMLGIGIGVIFSPSLVTAGDGNPGACLRTGAMPTNRLLDLSGGAVGRAHSKWEKVIARRKEIARRRSAKVLTSAPS